MRNAHRALLVGIVLAAVPTACADNKTAKDTTSNSESEVSATGVSGSAASASAGSKATTTTVKVEEDDVFALVSDGDVIGFRGGRTTAKDLAAVTAEPDVDTPMPVVFTTSMDKVLKARSRNQLRTVIANATDARPERPHADPMRTQRDQNGDLAIFVVIDNPTDTALADLKIDAQVLKGGTEPAGSASFVIGDEEVESLEAGSAVVALLTMGKDRLVDPDIPLNGIGLRLDLVATPG